MTAMDLTPYWPAEDWAGFLLVLVPAGKLPVPPYELRDQVRAHVETDTYEQITIALAPAFEPTPDWDRAFAATVIEAAMPDRHLFAPRALVGVVVVGERDRDVRRAYDDIRDLTFLVRLGARVGRIGIQSGSRRSVSPTSVARIADLARGLVTFYAEDPDAAIAESRFLDAISEQIREMNLYLPSLLPPQPIDEFPGPVNRPAIRSAGGQAVAAISDRPAGAGVPERLADPFPAPPRVEEAHPGRHAAITGAPGDSPGTLLDAGPVLASEHPSSQPGPVERPRETSWATRTSGPYPEVARVEVELPRPTGGTMAAPAPTRQLLDPVIHTGAEIVIVDNRTPLQKLAQPDYTDDATLDALRRDGRPVALVYLVLVPDEGAVSRQTSKERIAMALKLDKAFASVRGDAIANRPAHVAVEVLFAANPLQKHGIIRKAGALSESDLPKPGIEYFDLLHLVDPLRHAAGRTIRALDAREIEVASVHYVFLAAMAFPDDMMDEWMELLDIARVTWIDFSPARLRDRDEDPPSYQHARSPYGLHVLTDKEDVVAVVKKQSEVLYQYQEPAEPSASHAANIDVDDDTATTAPAAPPTGESRRWLPFGKRARS